MFRIVCFFLAILALLGVLTLGVIHEAKQSVAAYNHGICTECGGDYRFTSAVHLRNGGDRYYYTCQNCGHTIETVQLFN